MRFECTHCKHVGEPAEAIAHGTALSFRCERCGDTTPFQPRPRTPEPDGPVECPKCANRQSDPVACHRCGLVFSRCDPSVQEVDPAEEEAWPRVLASWDQEEVHDAYLATATEAGRLGDAAGRYRRLADDPERGADARRYMKRIVVLAEQALATTMKPPEPHRFKRALTFLAVLICLTLLCLMFWAFMR